MHVPKIIFFVFFEIVIRKMFLLKRGMLFSTCVGG